MRPICYLAGGIAGMKIVDAFNWRDDARRKLDMLGVNTLNPLRAKSQLHAAPRISTNFHDYESFGTFFTSRAIMVRDFTDVKRCDALLVNLLGAKKPSMGTIMELAWAYAFQKPAVVVIEEKGNPHDDHPMVHEAIPFRVTNLDDGLSAIAIILGG